MNFRNNVQTGLMDYTGQNDQIRLNVQTGPKDEISQNVQMMILAKMTKPT